MKQSNHKLSEKWGSYGYNLWVIYMLSCEHTQSSTISTSRSSPLVLPDLPHASSQMGIHQRIVQFNHYVYRQLVMESPHDTNRLRYITSDLTDMVHNSKIFIECNSKEFDCWNFRKDWFSNFNVEYVFLVGDYHIWSFTAFRESVLALSQISAPTSSLFTVAWTLSMSLSDEKTCIVRKMKNAHLVWGSMPVIDV